MTPPATLTITEAIAFLRRKGTSVAVYSPAFDGHVPSTKTAVIAYLRGLQQDHGDRTLDANGGELFMVTSSYTDTLYVD